MKDSALKRRLVSIYEYLYEKQRIGRLRFFYHLRILSPDATLRYIERHHCSIARFGDGEFDHILDLKDEGFQVRSERLMKCLSDVLSEKDNPNLLLCIPRCMNTIRGCNEHAGSFWIEWGRRDHHHEKIVEMIRAHAGRWYLFGDAQITRPYIDWKTSRRAERLFPKLKHLWAGKRILIVEGEQTRLGVGNDLFAGAAEIRRILAPATGAFEHYDAIREVILEQYQGALILLALGPTATVLAAELAGMGIQALDIGNIDIEYEWYRMGAKERVAIPGKFTNEASDGRSPVACNDETYLSEIVARVGC